MVKMVDYNIDILQLNSEGVIETINPLPLEQELNLKSNHVVSDSILETIPNVSGIIYLENLTLCSNASNDSFCFDDNSMKQLLVTPERVALCMLLLTFAISTIFGNSLVVIAVFRERYLHTVTNYFIMSLAVADCLVGLLVMPFSALYDSFDMWLFGPDFCDVWHSFDVLASTASILNLCVISLDRYWAITDPFSYPTKMSPKRAMSLIALVWVCSAVISFPAIAWWRAVSQPHPYGECFFTEDLAYLFFSSTISFYGPLLVMAFVYYKIFRAATLQTRSLNMGQKLVSSMGNGDVEITLRIHRGGGAGSYSSNESSSGLTRNQSQREKRCTCSRQNGDCSEESPCVLRSLQEVVSSENPSKFVSKNLKNFSLSKKICKFTKEKKAAKTLGTVMGIFIICWLPFFVNNLLMGLCPSCYQSQSPLVAAILTWLGWINSAMNPVIYACMARDFRRAFTRILCSCCPRSVRKKYQTGWRGGIAHVMVTPLFSAVNTPFIRAAATAPGITTRRESSRRGQRQEGGCGGKECTSRSNIFKKDRKLKNNNTQL